MKVPCLFFGMKGARSCIALVTPMPYIFFPKVIKSEGMAWQKQSGEGWVIFEWNQKYLRYEYRNHIFKDEVASWMKTARVSLNEIGEEPYPPVFMEPGYTAYFGQELDFFQNPDSPLPVPPGISVMKKV